jgi:hypothetical protein
LALCRALLGVEAAPLPIGSESSAKPKETAERVPAANVCPLCGEGRMVIVATFGAIPVNQRQWGLVLEPAEFDAS